VLLLSLPAYTAEAQSTGNKADSNTSVIIKISSISPTAGASFKISENSELRALGFVTTYSNLSPHDDQFSLDLSYLRYTNWISNESFDPYWGLDLNMLLEDPLIGPGVLLGTSYYLNPNFALFAEAGLNLFLRTDGGDATLGLHNSGIGIRIGL
jgi:hypothetical protein